MGASELTRKERIELTEKRFGETIAEAAIRMYGRNTKNSRAHVKMCFVCGRFCTNYKCEKCYYKKDMWGRHMNAKCFKPDGGFWHEKFNDEDKIIHLGKIGGDIFIIHNFYGND